MLISHPRNLLSEYSSASAEHRARIDYAFNLLAVFLRHVVVSTWGGMCPMSPIEYTDTRPDGFIAIHVILQLCSENLSHASGGN